MSHQCTTFVAEHSGWRKLNPCETLVGMVISWRHHHEKKKCEISVDEIASKAGISPRHVFRVLKQLEDRGLLKREVKDNGSAALDGRQGKKLGGRGHITSFVFVGFDAWAASRYEGRRVTSTRERVTSETDKDDMVSAPNKEDRFTGEKISGGEERSPAPSTKYSDEVGDKIDIRRMGEAHREAQKRPDSIGSLTDEQYFVWVCEQAGITVERGLYLQKKQRTWPEFNSKRPPERAAS